MTTGTSTSQLDPFSALFAEFEAELKKESPYLDGYLEKLRKDIEATPELVWKLQPEQVGLIVSGLATVSRIEIATAAKKTKKSDLSALEGILDVMAMNNGGSVIPKQKTAEEKAAALSLFGSMTIPSAPSTSSGGKLPWRKS